MAWLPNTGRHFRVPLNDSEVFIKVFWSMTVMSKSLPDNFDVCNKRLILNNLKLKFSSGSLIFFATDQF